MPIRKKNRILAALITLCLFAAALVLPVSAEDARFDGKSWEEITEDFLAGWNIDTSRITIGYENLVSGESGYFQGDQYMVACSVYKVPLNMVLSERVYNGEMDFDTLIEGIPYSYIEEHSIVHSSNEMAEAAQRAFADYADYRAALCPLLGEDADAMDYNFFHRNVFTARQIIHCLKTLYNDPERYPRVLDYMLAANPADTLIASLRGEVDVAHKYGFLEYEDHTYFNDTGIVYTEEPFALAVFTADLGAAARIIAEYAALMRDYTDYRTVKRAEEEAEAARPSPCWLTPSRRKLPLRQRNRLRSRLRPRRVLRFYGLRLRSPPRHSLCSFSVLPRGKNRLPPWASFFWHPPHSVRCATNSSSRRKRRSRPLRRRRPLRHTSPHSPTPSASASAPPQRRRKSSRWRVWISSKPWTPWTAGTPRPQPSCSADGPTAR